MRNKLELTGLLPALGNLLSFSTFGDRKIAGLWFASGISTQAGTMVYIYILVFLLGRMGGGLPTWENPPSRPSPNKFLFKLINLKEKVSEG